MGGLFSEDSILIRFLNRFTDYLWLGIMTAIGCLPVITLGVSFSSLFYCCNKMVKKEDTHLTDTFMKAYKANLKNGIKLTLIILVAFAIFLGDYFILYKGEEMFGVAVETPLALKVIVMALTIFCAMVCVHLCPLQATFENTVGNILKNAVLITITSLPQTVILLLLYLLPWVLFLFFPTLLIVLICFGFSIPYHISVYVYRGLLGKYGFSQEEEEDEMSASEGVE